MEECDKPLQVKLIESIITYISEKTDFTTSSSPVNPVSTTNISLPIRTSLTSINVNPPLGYVENNNNYNSNLPIILTNIIQHMINLLSTGSNYLIKNLSFYLPLITKNQLIFHIDYNREKLISLLSNIIMKHKNHKIRKYCC